jgi:type 1 glutamine amidotransferase
MKPGTAFVSTCLAACTLLLAQTSPPPRGPRAPNAEERERMEKIIPARAPAKPAKARRMLVLDINIGHGQHPSIPFAKLALELMASHTKAFEPVFDDNPEMLKAANLKQFDAIFLNSTIGPIFDTPELKESFVNFIRNGGGLAGYHAATFTNADWMEFSSIIGARNGYHREPTEKVTVKVDDPGSPLTKPFLGKTVQFTDEFFRFFDAPYTPARLHILTSFDLAKTDMNQGQCGGRSSKPFPPSVRCTKDDNIYPISWVRSEGKGRIFYTTMGHGYENFFEPLFLEHLLAGIQFALGDLETDTTPGNVKPQ